MKKKGKIRSDKDQVLRCLLLPESLLSKRQADNRAIDLGCPLEILNTRRSNPGPALQQ